MSTKRLSKTVIEGGRYGRNKFERRQSHVEVRAEERDYLKAVMSDLEHAEEYEIDYRQPVMKGFTDKLAPMYRWIEAQVGRSWDEVRSEIFTKFDIRTTAGRHVIFDHLLREVVDTTSGFDKRGHIVDPDIPSEPASGKYYYRYTADYYVDRQGILREDPNKGRRRFARYEFVSEQEYKDASAWLNGRMIGEKDGKLYWFVPMEGIWIASWHSLDKLFESFNFHNKLRYFLRENGSHEVIDHSWIFNTNMTGMSHGDYWKLVDNPFSFRQRGELTAAEAKIFRAFKEKIQDDILSHTKDR